MNRHVRYAVARFLGVDLATATEEQVHRVDFCTTPAEPQAVRMLLRAPDFPPPGVRPGWPRSPRR